MEETPITLKGTAEGIRVTPRSRDWAEILLALEHALEDAGAFFRGGRLILELGDRRITQERISALQALLRRFDIELWAILSEDAETVHLVRSHGILTRLPRETEPQKKAPPETVPPEQQALFLQQTLRSGQKVQYPGHVTLLGDVNPGAEIIAGGNIIVWGAIRGLAHAGAFGDESSVICALHLQPAQIRIAGYISRAPEQRRRRTGPEIVRIEEDKIVAETWSKRG